MLQPVATTPPTAAALLEDIAAASARCGVLLCEPYCRGGESTAKDEEEDNGHIWGEEATKCD